jgi:hypothetical protein
VAEKAEHLAEYARCVQATRVARIDQALAVLHARASEASWREIGEIAGVTSQAAWQQWREWVEPAEHAPKRKLSGLDRWLTRKQAAHLAAMDLKRWTEMPVRTSKGTNGEAHYRQSDVITFLMETK